MTPFWTPAKIALLERYWTQGWTAQHIGDKLGATRNAVIGKAHRLKLTPRGEPARVPVRQRIQRVKSAQPAAKSKLKGSRKTTTVSKPIPPRPIANETVPVGDVCAATMALKADDCRWPMGDPYTDRFMYCESKKLENYPYCEEHCRKAYCDFGAPRPPGKVK